VRVLALYGNGVERHVNGTQVLQAALCQVFQTIHSISITVNISLFSGGFSILVGYVLPKCTDRRIVCCAIISLSAKSLDTQLESADHRDD
jgi:Na+/alanine symporter